MFVVFLFVCLFVAGVITIVGDHLGWKVWQVFTLCALAGVVVGAVFR